MIRLHNTYVGKKEKVSFGLFHGKTVTMYHCGPTVYQYAHIGNLRAYIFSDILRRVFEYSGYTVKQVINITDVGHIVGDGDIGEDRIEISAKKEHKTSKEIATFYTEAFMKDIGLLNINIQGTQFPKATEYINEQIALVQVLEKKGFTYHTSDGIYFDSSKFKKYGHLGSIDLMGLEEGKRIGVNAEKKHLSDFALWKFSDVTKEKRDQEWPSPWGVGFPGWHIECSAMAIKLLGKTIDIHTGGVDHIPTHHNNEIAQSESATGKKFARYWLHCAHLMISGQKISKSIGNTIYLKDLMARGISPLAFRYWLLGASYHTQMNFTWEAVSGAHTAYERLISSISGLIDIHATPHHAETTVSLAVAKKYQQLFTDAIQDDLNTPRAIAIIWDILKDEKIVNEDKVRLLTRFDTVLGLNMIEGAKSLQIKSKSLIDEPIPDDVQEIFNRREVARKNKDWKTADMLRHELEQKGFRAVDHATEAVLKRI